MVDTWATVGSCAQIGKNVHLSGGVGIGGVLEPLQANPTIIEDNCFIGARSEVVEGVIVGEGSVLSMGVFIGASTKIVDRATGEVFMRPRAALFGGGVGHAAGQAAARRRARPVALLRRDRQARRRADPRQDLHQRAAAGLSARGRHLPLLRRAGSTGERWLGAACAVRRRWCLRPTRRPGCVARDGAISFERPRGAIRTFGADRRSCVPWFALDWKRFHDLGVSGRWAMICPSLIILARILESPSVDARICPAACGARIGRRPGPSSRSRCGSPTRLPAGPAMEGPATPTAPAREALHPLRGKDRRPDPMLDPRRSRSRRP